MANCGSQDIGAPSEKTETGLGEAPLIENHLMYLPPVVKDEPVVEGLQDGPISLLHQPPYYDTDIVMTEQHVEEEPTRPGSHNIIKEQDCFQLSSDVTIKREPVDTCMYGEYSTSRISVESENGQVSGLPVDQSQTEKRNLINQVKYETDRSDTHWMRISVGEKAKCEMQYKHPDSPKYGTDETSPVPVALFVHQTDGVAITETTTINHAHRGSTLEGQEISPGSPITSSRKREMERDRAQTVDKKHICSICDHKFAKKYGLAVHMRKHTGEKPFKCSSCDFRCTSNGNLTVHMRKHTGEKPYQCPYCDYSCRGKSAHVKHVRRHTGEKPFKCSLCEYRSTCSDRLVVHMRTHTGEKPFKCSRCDYRSASNSHLIVHTRTHTGEKPFKCSVCEYRSTNSSRLGEHLRTHDAGNPYMCSYCNYKCSERRSLVKHLRTHSVESHTPAPSGTVSVATELLR